MANLACCRSAYPDGAPSATLILLRSAHLTKPAFLFQSVGKLISEGAPPRRRGGAGGTHASPPSGVPGWEGGHKKSQAQWAVSVRYANIWKLTVLRCCGNHARVRVDLHVSTWGSFSDLSSWRISPVVEALIPTARRRQHLTAHSSQHENRAPFVCGCLYVKISRGL